MKQAYRNFVRIEPLKRASALETDNALDILEGTILSVGYDVKDLKKGMTVEFQYAHCKKTPNRDGGVIYYVEDKGIMSYEDSSKR